MTLAVGGHRNAVGSYHGGDRASLVIVFAAPSISRTPAALPLPPDTVEFAPTVMLMLALLPPPELSAKMPLAPSPAALTPPLTNTATGPALLPCPPALCANMPWEYGAAVVMDPLRSVTLTAPPLPVPPVEPTM
jgi:hypothetical protein